jgi:hypothetical protein
VDAERVCVLGHAPVGTPYDVFASRRAIGREVAAQVETRQRTERVGHRFLPIGAVEQDNRRSGTDGTEDTEDFTCVTHAS